MKDKWYKIRDYKLLRKGDKIKITNRYTLMIDTEQTEIRIGTLLTKAQFISTNTFGGYFAKVKWNDGSVDESYQVNRVNLKVNRKLMKADKILGYWK